VNLGFILYSFFGIIYDHHRVFLSLLTPGLCLSPPVPLTPLWRLLFCLQLAGVAVDRPLINTSLSAQSVKVVLNITKAHATSIGLWSCVIDYTCASSTVQVSACSV